MSRFFINRPIFAIVISLIIVILGTISAFNLPIAQYPQISPPTITVSTTYTSFFNSDTNNVTITLSDGTEYPVSGHLVQVDRSLTTNTGTLAINALFDNPDGLLLPGMFARVKVTGEVLPNAILIPQRAVQQLLDKTFVMVVGPDNKSVTKAITVGDKIGSYWIVKDGLDTNDVVVVEGLTKLQEGVPLNVTMVTPEELGLTF